MALPLARSHPHCRTSSTHPHHHSHCHWTAPAGTRSAAVSNWECQGPHLPRTRISSCTHCNSHYLSYGASRCRAAVPARILQLLQTHNATGPTGPAAAGYGMVWAHLHVRHCEVCCVHGPPVVTVGPQHHPHITILLSCRAVTLHETITTQPVDAIRRHSNTCVQPHVQIPPSAPFSSLASIIWRLLLLLLPLRTCSSVHISLPTAQSDDRHGHAQLGWVEGCCIGTRCLTYASSCWCHACQPLHWLAAA